MIKFLSSWWNAIVMKLEMGIIPLKQHLGIPADLSTDFRPPNQNMNFFPDKLSEQLDIYSKHYEILGTLLILTQLRKTIHMINFMNNQCLSNLIKL